MGPHRADATACEASREHPGRPRPTRGGRAGTALLAACAGLLLVLTAGCWGAEPSEEAPAIRVGVGSTTEQRTLAGLTRLALEEAGFEVVLVADLGDTLDVRAAALDGEIDLYWGYTGATWSLALGRAQPSTDPQESFEAVQAADLGNGLRWLPPSSVNATLALFVRGAERPDGDGATLTWLAGQLATAPGGLCADGGFLAHPTGFPALADAYAISDEAVQTTALAEAKAVSAVAAGECFAGLATATSAQAASAGLAPVRDDQGVFPAFVVAPVVRVGSAADDAAVSRALQQVATSLDTPTLAALNARVAAGEDPGEVASTHLSVGEGDGG